jgi:mono/diheme cytochrome c family protein
MGRVPRQPGCRARRVRHSWPCGTLVRPLKKGKGLHAADSWLCMGGVATRRHRPVRPVARSVTWLLAAAALAGGWTLPGRAQADAEPRFAAGAAPFAANCVVCHRANGAGTPGLAPPVTGYPPRFMATAEGRRQLVLTLLFGMFGEIVVDERHYNFKMPDFARLDDVALAATLNYLVFDLGHAPPDLAPLTVTEVTVERARGLDGSAVRQHRAEVVGALHP